MMTWHVLDTVKGFVIWKLSEKWQEDVELE